VNRFLLFWRTLRILLSSGGQWQSLEEPWTQEDSLALKAYLSNPTGQNFLKRMRAMSLMLNRNAVMTARPWKNGHCAGYMQALTDIQLLQDFSSSDSTQEVAPEDRDQFGADVDLDSLLR
jgi:hypothetical protein